MFFKHSMKLNFGMENAVLHCPSCFTFTKRLQHVTITSRNMTGARIAQSGGGCAMQWMVWGLVPGRGKRVFISPKHPVWHWGSPSLLFTGYGGFFSHGMNQLRHKDHQSPPSNDEATSEQSYTSWYSWALMVWTGTTLPLPLEKKYESLLRGTQMVWCVWETERKLAIYKCYIKWFVNIKGTHRTRIHRRA